MMDKIVPPWTSEQVAALNSYQRAGRFHPFTCGNRDENRRRHRKHPVLRATRVGWVCDACGYRQTWAHAFMATPEASQPLRFAEEKVA